MVRHGQLRAPRGLPSASLRPGSPSRTARPHHASASLPAGLLASAQHTAPLALWEVFPDCRLAAVCSPHPELSFRALSTIVLTSLCLFFFWTPVSPCEVRCVLVTSPAQVELAPVFTRAR